MKPFLDESLDPLDPDECAFCGRVVNADNPANCPAQGVDDARCRVSETPADGIYVQPFGRPIMGPYRTIPDALKVTSDWIGEELACSVSDDGKLKLEYRASPGWPLADIAAVVDGEWCDVTKAACGCLIGPDGSVSHARLCSSADDEEIEFTIWY